MFLFGFIPSGSGPQPLWKQGLVVGKTVFPRMGMVGGGNVSDVGASCCLEPCAFPGLEWLLPFPGWGSFQLLCLRIFSQAYSLSLFLLGPNNANISALMLSPRSLDLSSLLSILFSAQRQPFPLLRLPARWSSPVLFGLLFIPSCIFHFSYCILHFCLIVLSLFCYCC